jgi:hypothetical protein
MKPIQSRPGLARRILVATLAVFAVAATSRPAAAAEAVVLKGGGRIELASPPVQQGNNALLTRTDGTLFSVPMSEVDWKATAALKTQKSEAPKPAVVAPPSTPAEAVRTGREEKARVKVTDADVGHQAEPPPANGQEKKASQMPANSPRVELLDYTQQKQGDMLVVNGQLQNPGTLPATNVRLAVTATGEDGVQIGSTAAVLSNGTIEGGKTVSFTASIAAGDRVVAALRFSPQWWSPPPPPPSAGGPPTASGTSPSAAPAAGAAAPAAAPAPAAPSQPPGPKPTPYGQGLLYAAPAASAPSEAPADGKTGYIPGASSPDNQPKPPQ